MSSLDRLKKKEKVHHLTEDFNQIFSKIGKSLDRSIPSPKIELTIQEEPSPVKIPDYGKRFGIIYQNNTLTFASWLFTLPKKEQKTLLNFLLIREGFRFYIDEQLPDSSHCYQELIDICLNNIATLWMIQENDYRIMSPQIVYIRARTAFEDSELFNHIYWDSFMLDCYDYNISPSQVFDVLIRYLNIAIAKDQSLKELKKELKLWIVQRIRDEDLLALPIYMNQRHFAIIKALNQLDYEETSAKNVGKIIGRSYNVVNINFKELYDKYQVYWRVNINLPLLKLYPYFFRLQLTNADFKTPIIKKFKKVPYLKELDESYTEEKVVLAGLLECPHYIHNQLSGYFNRLKEESVISDFFFQMIRRRRLTSSIARKQLEPTKETFQKLLGDFNWTSNYQTIVLLDENFDITNPPEPKETIFDENVLAFISILRAHYLGKAHYMFAPLNKAYELCKRNDIDSTDTRAVMSFVNQLDLRCRRLGLINYFLNILSIGNFGRSLYWELLVDPTNSALQELLKKLERFSGMVVSEFYDRVTLHFPKVNIHSPFRPVLEKILQRKELDYLVYQFNYSKDYLPKISYYELYDFEEQRWKIKTS